MGVAIPPIVQTLSTTSWETIFAEVQRRQKLGVDVVPHSHPALRRPVVPVQLFDEQLRRLIELMFETTFQWKGVGLAAPQLGLPIQLFVINATGDRAQRDKDQVFVNPVIRPVRHSKGTVKELEGCLSLPGLAREVRRERAVAIEWQDETGKSHKQQYQGPMSRYCQHEHDHLQGKLFIDHLEGSDQLGVPEWLNYLGTQFEQYQSYGHFASIQTLQQDLDRLEKFFA